MISKTIRYGGQSLVMIALMLAIILGVNILASRPALRGQLDLTRERLHTIPVESLRVVEEIEDVINVTVYLTPELPDQVKVAERQLRDKLAIYADAADGNLRIEYVDPAEQEASGPKGLMSPMQLKGIQPSQINIREKDEIRAVRIYFGLEVQYLDKSEVIPYLLHDGGGAGQLIPDFEYLFTAKLKKVSSPKEFRVAFATNRKGFDLAKEYAATIAEMRKQYPVTASTTITADKPVQGNLDVLILASPINFTAGELYQIDQFVMRGGRLIALVDRVDLKGDTSGQQPMPALIESNVTRLLTHYGVTVNDDMVLDRMLNVQYMMPAPNGRGGTIIPYAAWPRVPPNQVNREHPLMRPQGAGMAFPWASSLTLEGPQSGSKVTPLLTSSPASWRQVGKVDLNPTLKAPADKDVYTTSVLGAAITGPLTSYFAEHPLDDDATTGGPDTSKMLTKTRQDAQIVVIGDAEFCQDKIMSYRVMAPQFAVNAPFIPNVVDWMTIGQDLMTVRSRGTGLRPIKTGLGEGDKAKARYLNMLLVPALVVAFGLLVMAVRRYNRRRLKDIYDPMRSTDQ